MKHKKNNCIFIASLFANPQKKERNVLTIFSCFLLIFPKDIKIAFDTYRLLLIFSDFIDELEIKQGDRNLKMNYAKSIY